MLLSDAAAYFDTMPCLDGYTGDLLFYGQLGLYDDNKRDSETSERRVLSVTASVTPPTRRVIEAAGSRWIVGHGNPDSFAGGVIRRGFVLQEAPTLANIRTLGEVCLGDPGVDAYAGRAWIKNAAYTEQDSKLTPQHHLHFSPGEPVLTNRVVDFDGLLYLVRSINYGPGGTLIAMCDELAAPVTDTGTLTTGVYDPVTEVFGNTGAPTTVVRVRWQSLFQYQNGMAPKFDPGDIQLAVAKIVAVKTGSKITLSDGIWFIQSVIDEGDVWMCRATRHGG